MQHKTLLFLLFLLLLPVGAVAGQSASPNFVVQRFSISSGVSAESSNFQSTGVIGQPTNDISTSANYQSNGGFLVKRNTIPTAITLSTTSNSPATPLALIITTASLLLIAAAYLHRRQS